MSYINKSTITFLSLIALSILFLPGRASATPIFSQEFDPMLSSANGNSNFATTSQRAENFTINVDEILGSISWLGIYQGSTPVSDNFTLRLFAQNLSGLPEMTASVLDMNVMNNVTRTDTGRSLGSSDLFSYHANLTSGVSLDSGIYWLSIVNNVTGMGTTDWGWAAASTGGASAFRSSDADDALVAWGSGSGTFQFKLTAVPVPAAFWLMATALVGLLSLKRRKAV